MKVVGYGICGPGEADKYLKETLDEFERLCDETIILTNNATSKEKDLIDSYGFERVEDNREWGKNQNRLKEDFLKNHVSKLDPEWCICLDMDETFDKTFTKEKLEEYQRFGDGLHFYVTNLWDDGYSPQWSFWNIRAWRWKQDMLDDIGDKFFAFEQRPLHCGLAPKWAYMIGGYAPHLLVHSGLQQKSVRDAKVERYEKYDPKAEYRDRSYYEALANCEAEPYEESLVLRDVQEEVASYKQKPKKLYMIEDEPILYFKRKKDGMILDTPKSRSGGMMDDPNFELVHEVSKPDEVAPLVKKDKKDFVYVANHSNTGDDDTEGHISRALQELGYDVEKVQEGDEVPDGKVLLCHKWIPDVAFSGKKVVWYFDKVDFGEERKAEVMAQLEATDYFFTSDGDFVEENGSPKLHLLRQGIGYDNDSGEKIDAPDIVFLGSPYGERKKWISGLTARYGDKFKAINNKFNKELNDICVSAKITLAPEHPGTKQYWSNRVYNTVGRGAFMIHPDCDLKDELKDGEHIAYYSNEEQMYEQIDYYLTNWRERQKIQKAGAEKVRREITYKTRLKKLCDTIH